MSKENNGSKQPFPYTWVSEAKFELDSRYLVKGLMDHGSFTLIFGPSGSGKSFFTADLAQHIATGQSWRGRKVNQSLVVYVASEAGASILKRFVCWRENRIGESAESIPLAILTRGPNLILKPQVAELRSQLLHMQEESKTKIGLVIFDTLSRSMPGGDENKAEHMTEVISVADYLRDEFKAATAFVHHSGKDAERGARGHSSLFAAADCVIRVDERIATIDKVRDGVSGERFPFVLEPIEIGTDIDGDSVYTCLLSASDSSAPQKRQEPVGKNQRIVLKELRALSPNGDVSPGTSEIPKGVRIVRFEDLASKAVPRFAGQTPFRARGRITEAVASLQANGYVGVLSDLLWLT